MKTFRQVKWNLSRRIDDYHSGNKDLISITRINKTCFGINNKTTCILSYEFKYNET